MLNKNYKNFALIGLAGYVAERHLKAIKTTGNKLVCALDKSDSVGICDSYFPESDFFVEFERFDRHIDKLRRSGNEKIDYVSICSPNYLHDSHIRFALKQNADAICEKPMVLNPWNVNALQEFEKETGNRIWNILQLRLHPSIISIKEKYSAKENNKIHDIDLCYIASRGNWYNTSWKADISKSGGLETNIGVHFFDMLGWIFGPLKSNTVHLRKHNKAAGYIELKNARIRWYLSIDYNDLPEDIKRKNQRTYRSIIIDKEEIEFSDGFTDLHTESYKNILKGKGFGIDEVRQSIQTVYEIRNATPIGPKGNYHPLIK
ncbi:Gfo/Idh/MocA family oxidoreductase [Bacteroidota bacterium]